MVDSFRFKIFKINYVFSEILGKKKWNKMAGNDTNYATLSLHFLRHKSDHIYLVSENDVLLHLRKNIQMR